MWEQLLNLGSKLLGGLMGQNAQENANAANMALQQTQMAYQHQANTHGIRWKVEDAIAAGLHPLAALGVSPASGFSASVGRQEPETGMSDAMSSIGQDISRAIMATRTQREREHALSEAAARSSVKSSEIDNEIKALRLAVMRQQLGPPFSGDVNVEAYKEDVRPKGSPATAAGTNPSLDYFEVSPGVYRPSQTNKYKQSTEDNFIRETLGDVEQLIAPTFSDRMRIPPPNIPLKEGHKWVWVPQWFAYTQKPIKDQSRFDWADREFYPENNILRLR